MPDLAFGGEHEEKQEWNEGRSENYRVERGQAGNDYVTERVGFLANDLNGLFGVRLGLGPKSCDAVFDAFNTAFDGAGHFLDGLTKVGPVGRELVHAKNECPADDSEESNNQKDDDERAERARDVQALEVADQWIEEVGHKHGDQQSDDDAGSPIAESDDDAGGDDALRSRAGAHCGRGH